MSILLVVVTITAVLLSLRVQSKRRVENAVRFIQQIGGTVDCDSSSGLGAVMDSVGLQAPEEQRVYVWLPTTASSVGGLLAQFPQLRSVTVSDHGGKSPQDPTQLSGVYEIHTLRICDIHIAEITSASFVFPSVQDLDVSGATISASTLRKLVAASRCTYVRCRKVHLHGGSFQSVFLGLEHITFLDVTASNVSETDAEAIAELPNLRVLRLGSTSVGRATCMRLSALPNLTFLDLSGASVDDDSIAALAASRSLREVDLAGSMVSADGAARLREAMPNCRIVTSDNNR